MFFSERRAESDLKQTMKDSQQQTESLNIYLQRVQYFFSRKEENTESLAKKEGAWPKKIRKLCGNKKRIHCRCLRIDGSERSKKGEKERDFWHEWKR